MNRNVLLKYVAMITMIIDHIGAIYYEDTIILRIIGRISFPIFAYLISEGFRYTRSYEKYRHRLLILAIASQIPYILAFGLYRLNVIFTLLFGLMLLQQIKKKNYIIAAAIIVLVLILTPSYGLYGIFTILIFYYCKGFIIFIILHLLNYLLFLYSPVQGFAFISIILLYWKFDFRYLLPNKFINYVYPVHLALFSLINIMG